MGWRLRKPSVPSLQDWWDREREILKRLALQHWSRARNDRCLPRSFLSALATHLKGKIDDDTISLVPVYERVFAPMAAIDLTEAEAAWVRSLVKWAEEGETSASYFFATGEEAWSWQRQFFSLFVICRGVARPAQLCSFARVWLPAGTSDPGQLGLFWGILESLFFAVLLLQFIGLC